MFTRAHRLVASALALLAAALAVPASAQLVSTFEVQQSVVSPDGDGKSDSTRVRYSLADNALSVSVVVFEADSITPVDTLRAPAPDSAPGTRTMWWKGLRWDGSSVPEGVYVVRLEALGESDPDETRFLPVFVDVTRPTLSILSVTPDPYAPGVAGANAAVNIAFVVGDASPVSPGRLPDELQSAFASPAGTAVVPASLVTTPPFTGADGAYTLSWNAGSQVTSLSDGEYRVTLTLVDAAGYSVAQVYHFDIDTEDPRIKATSLAENAAVRVVPDSLRGYAYDERGVDSLLVRYREGAPYALVTSTSVADDTLRFAVVLADSIQSEGSYRLDFRAVDTVGREATYAFPLRYDVSAPPAPVLDAFYGTSRSEQFTVRGQADDGGDLAALVRIRRNGVLVDSVSTLASDIFAVDVALLPGTNSIVAYLRDGAGNVSGPSNTVTVRFDTGAGLFVPAPFVPGAIFAVNLGAPAGSVALRVFDVTGDLVIKFDDTAPRQYYSFSWDGHNGTGVAVRKGPLVAVATVEYDDGTRDVFREVFLFDPDAP